MKVTELVDAPQGEMEEQREGPLLRILRKVQERRAELPSDTGDDLPTYLAKNKKHYLYGHPKDEG